MGAVILLIVSSMGANGLSSWKETATEFPKGQLTNLVIGPDGLTLNETEQLNESWTRMSCGVPYGGSSLNPLSAYDSASKLLLLIKREWFNNGNPETWTYNITSGEWNQRYCHSQIGADCSAMAYDSANGAMVLYGNAMGTWTYNVSSNVWTDLHPTNAPHTYSTPSMDYDSMVYDSANDQMILFGGTDNYSSPGNQTWTYNMGTNTWTNMNPTNAPASYYHAIAYDSRNGVVVAFGSFGSQVDSKETWIYNPDTNIWTNQTPIYTPLDRQNYAMAYDTLTSQTILFGGVYENSNYLNDTWTFNVTNKDWTEMFPSSSPSPRGSYTMAYDTDRHLAIIWGGFGQTPFNDLLWAYDANINKWMNLTTHDLPSCRQSHAMVYDSSSGVTVLFGGLDGSSALGDTYTYNLSTNNWRNMDPSPAPPARSGHAMAYDSYSGKVILFGGGNGTNYFNDTWSFDAKSNIWTDMKPSSSPGGGEINAMAYDSAHKVMVFFGGSSGCETWIYETSTNTWTNMKPVVSPPPTDDAVMTYDDATGEMLLFTDTMWTYNMTLNTWTDKHALYSPMRMVFDADTAIVYDSAKDLTVLFGGFIELGLTSLNETYVYNANDNVWTEINTSITPSIRGAHAMVYDDKEGKIILFGGYDGMIGQNLMSDIWTLELQAKQYYGIYTSAPFDTGGTAYFGTLEWTSIAPSNISVGLQLRSADNPGNLATRTFAGPDNTSGTYYHESGQRINSIHNGSRWVQYRAVLLSLDSSVSPALKSVTINYNLLQTVTIDFPHSGDNWTGIQLINWSAQDLDNDSLSFDIYLANETGNNLLVGGLSNSTHQWLWNTSSVPNGTYRIIVSARDDNPSIPLVVNATSDYFVINHYIPPFPNHPPRITSIPPSEIRVGDLLQYDLNASDEDGDNLSFSLISGPQNMYLDIETGILRWTPGTVDVGNHTITVIVVDGRGGMDEQTFILKVLEASKPPPSPEPPHCTIVFPTNNSKVGGRIIIRGTAENGTLALIIIQVRIDGDNWTTAVGLKNWTLSVNLGKMKNGRHTIEVRAFDGSLYSDTGSVEFTVANPKPSVSSGGSPWCLPAIILVVMAGMGGFLLLRKTKREA